MIVPWAQNVVGGGNCEQMCFAVCSLAAADVSVWNSRVHAHRQPFVANSCVCLDIRKYCSLRAMVSRPHPLAYNAPCSSSGVKATFYHPQQNRREESDRTSIPRHSPLHCHLCHALIFSNELLFDRHIPELQNYVHTVINIRAVAISMQNTRTHTSFLLLYALLFHIISIRPYRPFAGSMLSINERQKRARRP